MSMNIKRRLQSGFTLIELLIVVIILAILAAIAIPQFTASTSDAQLAALDANLSTVRTALEQYRVQHTGNVYPGAVASGSSGCGQNNGAAVAGDVGSPAMLAQLSNYTNAAGQACTVGDATNFKYGPYLRQGVPAEPFSNVKTVTVAAASPLVAVANGTGWSYNTTTGQFISSNLNTDPGGTRKFSEH